MKGDARSAAIFEQAIRNLNSGCGVEIADSSQGPVLLANLGSLRLEFGQNTVSYSRS